MVLSSRALASRAAPCLAAAAPDHERHHLLKGPDLQVPKSDQHTRWGLPSAMEEPLRPFNLYVKNFDTDLDDAALWSMFEVANSALRTSTVLSLQLIVLHQLVTSECQLQIALRPLAQVTYALHTCNLNWHEPYPMQQAPS